MADSLTVESLVVEITSTSAEAAKGIDALVASLRSLRDVAKGSSGLSNINKQIKDIKTRLSAIEGSSTGAAAGLDKVAKSGERAGAGLSRTTLSLASVRLWLNSIQRATRVLGEVFNASSDYIEAINLATVTMREGTQAALDYAQAVESLVGINQTEWITNLGTFNQMFLGFGVASQKAAQMSQQLTQLGYDIQSVFNEKDLDMVMGRLSAGIAGQIKGMREYGVELSVAAMQEYAYSKGITESWKAMTQAEKASLRYMKIMETTKNLQGDLARTIATPSNAVRLLNAQWEITKRYLGQIVSVIAVELIPYLKAATQIIGEMAKGMAAAMGFTLPEVNYSGLDAITTDAEDAEEAVESLKRSLIAGFDELNRLGNSEDAGISVSDVLAGFNIDDYSYDFLANINTENLDKYKQTMGEILTIVGTIATVLLTWKLSTAFMSVLTNFATLKVPIGITAVVSGVVLEFSGIYDAAVNGLTLENGIKAALGSALALGGSLLLLGTGPAGWLVGLSLVLVTGIVAISAAAETNKREHIESLYNNSDLKTTIDALIARVEETREVTANLVIDVKARISDRYQTFEDSTEDIEVATALLEKIFDLSELPTKTNAEISELKSYIDILNGMKIDGLTLQYDDLTGSIDKSRDAIEDLIDTLTKQYQLEAAKDLFIEALKDQLELEKALGPEQEVFDGLIAQRAAMAAELQKIWDGASEGYEANVLAMVERGGKELDWLQQLFSDKRILTLSEVERESALLLTEGLKPLDEAINTQETKLSDLSGAYTDAMDSVDFFREKISFLALELNNIDGTKAEVEIVYKTTGLPQIGHIPGVMTPTAYAGGGYPSRGELFIANEAGAELVGSIGGRTAVANGEDVADGIAGAVGDVLQAYIPVIVRAIQQNKTEVYIGDEDIARAANRGNRVITSRVGV